MGLLSSYIKHVFDIPGIVFVLAIDREQLSNSAKSLFGSDLNANEYLRKFIARSFHLPKPDENGVRTLAERLYERFMVVENVRDSEFKERYLRDQAVELCAEFEFTLRQIEEFFRLLGHVFATKKSFGRTPSSWLNGYLFLCALKIHDAKFYRDLCRGGVATPDLMQMLKRRMEPGDAERWTCLCYTGMYAGSGSPGFYEYLRQQGLLETDLTAGTKLEMAIIQNWGYTFGNRISKIFNQIESATSM